MTEVPSFCRICLNGCALRVEVEGGRAVRVSGDRNNPVYKGFTCVKGRAQPQLLGHPDRLRHALKRGPDGKLVPIPTTQAIEEIARRLHDIIDRYGPRSVAGYLGTFSWAAVPTAPLFNGFMDAIGSPLRFSPGTIDKPGKKIALALHGSWMAPARGFDDPDVMLLFGINPLVTFTGFPYGNPGKWLGERLDSGMKLIVIDPRRSDVARRAQLHMQARPGEDVAIAAGLIRVILEEGLFDQPFVAENVTGLEELRRAVSPFSPEEVGRRADIAATDLVLAARTFASASRAYVMAGTGPNMSGVGTLIEYLLLSLQTLCGQWMRAGERVRHPGTLLPALKPKAQASPPRPAYALGDFLHVRGLGNTAAGLPTAALPDEILLDGDRRVRALLSCAGNPAGAWPDQDKAIEAMRSLDLLVQVDPWLSATARLAHYVIAPKIWLEVAGTSQGLDLLTRNGTGYGQVDAYGQYSPALVDPPEGSDLLEEWEFFYRLARSMGLELSISPQPGIKGSEIRLDMNTAPTTDMLLDRLSDGSRIPLADVKKFPSGALFPDPAVHVAKKEANWTGRFELANREMLRDLAAIAAAPATSQQRAPNEFRLLCRRVMHVYNTTFVKDALGSGRSYNPAYLHPADLKGLGITEGDAIEIRSDVAAIYGIAHADETLREGLVSMSFGFGGLPEDDQDFKRIGSNPTRLQANDRVFDPYSGQPLMTNLPVRIRRHDVESGSV
jgi:anaerobic selenocysteine-containing dehydrogenase